MKLMTPLSLLILFLVAAPLHSQRVEMAEEQKKQMETQFIMQQLMMLGHDSELRKELEVVEDQVEKVKKLSQDYQKEMMKFYSDNREMIEEMQKLYQDGETEAAQEMGKAYQEKNREFMQGHMEKVQEVLLPHQIDRLKQIAKQQQTKLMNRFNDEFGVAVSLADELGLTAQEKKRLIDTVKKARDEYYKTVEAAKKKAKDKILGVLTTEQKEKMTELIGDDWDQDAMRRKNREESIRKWREKLEKDEEK